MARRDVTGWRDVRATQPFWAPLSSFRRELDRLFDDFLAPGETSLFGTKTLQPNIEVDETDDGYNVTAELPGLDQKDIELELRENVLKIAGQKHEEHEQDMGGRCYSERSYGMFERRIPLASEVDPENIDARFTNGVLRIKLRKNPVGKENGRRIQIKS